MSEKLILAIIVAVLSVAATTIIVNLKIKTGDKNKVNQKGNKVGGDMAGRDIRK